MRKEKSGRYTACSSLFLFFLFFFQWRSNMPFLPPFLLPTVTIFALSDTALYRTFFEGRNHFLMTK